MSRGIWAGLAMAIALGAGAIGIVVGNQGGGGGSIPEGTANIWIQVGGGTCTGGRSATPIDFSSAGTPDRICGTFNEAFNALTCGDVGVIRAGVYPTQDISGNKGCTVGTYATLQAETAAGDRGVEVNDLNFNASGAHLKSIYHKNTITSLDDDNVWFENYDNGGIFFTGSNNLKLTDSDVECLLPSHRCGYHSQIGGSTAREPSGMLIQNNYFHDWEELTASSGQHTECLQIHGADGDNAVLGSGMTLRGNKFNKCCDLDFGSGTACTAALHITHFNGPGDTQDVLLENNWFGPDVGNSPIQYGVYDRLVIRFNSFTGAPQDVSTRSGVGSYFIGNNVGQWQGFYCTPPQNHGMVFRYNIFEGSAGNGCDATDSANSTNDFVQSTGTGLNLHLATTTSPPNNKVPTSVTHGCPAEDIDGEIRPIDANCDAGSDEQGDALAALANIYVVTSASGDTCARSSTPTSYAAADAGNRLCTSLSAAYTAANAGDTILLKSGTYGDQVIPDRSSLSTSQYVYIHPAPGEAVTFTSLDVQTHDVHIDGGDTIDTPEVDRITVNEAANAVMDSGEGPNRDVIFEDIHARNSFNTAHGFTLQYSEIGPQNVCTAGNSDLIQFWPNAGTPTNMRLLYNTIHDNNWNACSSNGDHPDAFQVYPAGGTADNIDVIGNRFWHCGTQCIFMGDGDYINSNVENNMVEETSSCVGCGASGEVNFFSTTGGSDTFKYNTVEGSVINLPTSTPAVGNVFLTGHTCSSATYSFNRFPVSGGSTCGTNSSRCTPILADGNSYSGDNDANWHIGSADTCAKSTGNPSDMPLLDLDRESRPIGVVDAGADERG